MARFDFSNEAQLTNREFAEQLAGFTTLTVSDVERMFPRKVDKKRFAQLMQIVNASANRNARTAAVGDNFKVFGGAVMRLLEQFV